MKLKSFGTIIKYWIYHKIGFCNICGNPTIFLCSDPDTSDRNMTCLVCQSNSRQRMMASSLLSFSTARIRSLKKFAHTSTLKILNTDTGDVISRCFEKNENFINSGYFPEKGFGTQINLRTYSQNLEALSFPNESFDMVITEHVFEHVRNYTKGFKEVYRVLKKGGVHLFTIPFHFDKETVVRVETSTPNDIMLLPPEYHGDHHNSSNKILTYRKFGINLFGELNRIGFSTRMIFSTYPKFKTNGIIGSFVFESKKN